MEGGKKGRRAEDGGFCIWSGLGATRCLLCSTQVVAPNRTGPASLQRFAGEDLSRDSRVKSQKQQLRSWIKDAVSVKEQQRTEAAQEEKEYADFVDEVEAIRLEAEVDAQREARLASVETFSVNQHLAAARAQAATELDLEQKALGEAEVEREINSKWLNEDPSQAVSAVNPKRYRTDHFKGFAPEVVGKIIKTVDSQLQDKADAQRAELEEKELEANFGDQIRDIMAEQNFQTKMDRAVRVEVEGWRKKEHMGRGNRADARFVFCICSSSTGGEYKLIPIVPLETDRKREVQGRYHEADRGEEGEGGRRKSVLQEGGNPRGRAPFWLWKVVPLRACACVCGAEGQSICGIGLDRMDEQE